MSLITSTLHEDRWSSVLDVAHEHMTTVSVTDLADHAGYSPFHFTRLFSAHIGIGPSQYLTALRIDAAKRMLLAEPYPVIDVATAVGFDSLSSFTRRFRHTVGIPPGQLRRLADRRMPWRCEDTGEQFGHYHLLRNHGALVGGAMDVSDFPGPDGTPLPSSWSVYLAVDDIDARLVKVTAHGGTVLSAAMDIGNSGRMAMITDPTGAEVGMWQAADLEGYEVTGTPGSPVWFELMTHGFDEACAFYAAVFDANLVPMSESLNDDG